MVTAWVATIVGVAVGVGVGVEVGVGLKSEVIKLTVFVTDAVLVEELDPPVALLLFTLVLVLVVT